MIDVNSIKASQLQLIKGIIEKRREAGDLVFWTLYLDASQIGMRIDTCATSQCISMLTTADKSSLLDDHYRIYICKAINTIVRLRDQKGAWPSEIAPHELKEFSKRAHLGDIAIGDNYFALTALLDADFLDKNFRYSEFLTDELKSLSGRIKFICKSIDWLFDNQATDSSVAKLGWNYTNSKESYEAATLTTTNVLLVLSRILYKLRQNLKNGCESETEDFYKEYINKLFSSINTTLKYATDDKNLKLHFGDIPASYSVGKIWGKKGSSLIHTCKLINLLYYNKKYNFIDNDKITMLGHFIVSRANKPNLFSSDGISQMICFEPYQLSKVDEFIGLLGNINIDHENYAEGIILFTLINMRANGYPVEPDLIEKNWIALAKLSDDDYDDSIEFYRCRSTRNTTCHYPVYASHEAYMAIDSYLNLLKISSEPIASNNQFKEQKDEIESYIQALENFSKATLTVDKPQYYEHARGKILMVIAKCKDALNQTDLTKMKKLYNEARQIISDEKINLNQTPQ